jgi:hypothetical protein
MVGTAVLKKAFVVATVVLLGAVHAPAQAPAISSRETSAVEYVHSLGSFVPVWGRGGLYGADYNPSDEPIIWRVAPDGKREDIRFSFPGGHEITITGIVERPDEGLVITGSAYSDDGKGATLLSIISPDRATKTITRVWPFVPHAVTLAPDGVIWAVGWIRNGESVSANNVLERFDSTGRLLSTSLIKARGVAWSSWGDATDHSSLHALPDRVGWLTGGGEYIEFSLDGKEISRLDVPRPMVVHKEGLAGFVVADAGRVVAALPTDPALKIEPTLWLLNLDRRGWTQIPGSLPWGFSLAGFDGKAVVATGMPAKPATVADHAFLRFQFSGLEAPGK